MGSALVLPLRHLLQGARGDAHRTRRHRGPHHDLQVGPELRSRTIQTNPLVPTLRPVGSDPWRVDETYIRIGEKWCFLTAPSPNDATPWTSTFPLADQRTQRNNFLPSPCAQPSTMGNPESSARIEIRHWRQRSPLQKLRAHAHQRWNTRSKYCNKVIEGDYRRLKHILVPEAGSTTPTTAYRPLQGMEAMHSVRKDQGTLFAYGAPCSDAVIVAEAFQHLQELLHRL